MDGGSCLCRLHRRRLGLRQALVLVVLASLAATYYTMRRAPERPKLLTALTPRQFCAPQEAEGEVEELASWVPGQVRVLLFISSPGGQREVKEALGAVRVKYKVTVTGRPLPEMVRSPRGQGKYLAILFQDLKDYLAMPPPDRALLDAYCRQNRAGVIGFTPSAGGAVDLATNSTPFRVVEGRWGAAPSSTSHPLLRILKKNTNMTARAVAHTAGLVALAEGVEELLVVAGREGGSSTALAVAVGGPVPLVAVAGSSGEALRHWYLRLLLLDALGHVSAGQVSLPLTRLLMVDVDDMFVGTARLVASDVAAMVASQARLAAMVPGFRYNLGFSGKTFLAGTEEEDEGDLALVAARDSFWWFPHMWRHLQPHR